MPNPATIAAVAAGLNSLKGLFSGGGGGGNAALQQVQEQIARFMLSQAQRQAATTDPFREQLAALLQKRVGQQLPISGVSNTNIKPALTRVTPGTRTLDPASFLAQKASLAPAVNPATMGR